MKYWFLILIITMQGSCVSAQEIKKLLIIGDGMTKNAPMPEQGWKGNWGMAATSEEKDYAHLLIKRIKTVCPHAQLVLDNIMYEDTMTGWDHLVPNDADIIIIQLGDNYKGGVSLVEYQAAYQQMVGELRGNFFKTVICIGPWNNKTLAPYIAKAAKAANAKFVLLDKIAADPANRAAADAVFPLLGKQPGNRGMKLIAEAIWKVLVFQNKTLKQ